MTSDTPGAGDVLSAAAWVEQHLRPRVADDWSVPAGNLEWSVRDVVDHLADVCGFYSIHLAARSSRRLSVDVRPHADASNGDRLDIVVATGQLLAATITHADPATTAWHFRGPTDAPGFASVACNELLVHGWDAARGLGFDITGDEELSGRVLRRTFPEVRLEGLPWALLLSANGRH